MTEVTESIEKILANNMAETEKTAEKIKDSLDELIESRKSSKATIADMHARITGTHDTVDALGPKLVNAITWRAGLIVTAAMIIGAFLP